MQGGKNADTWFLGAVLLTGLGIGWVWVQSRKIIIGPSGISFRTWRGGYTLPWEDVKVIGGMLKNKDEFQMLSEQEMEHDEWMGQKFIYVTTRSGQIVAPEPRNEPGFLYLQYRPEVWNLIQNRLDALRQPTIRSFRDTFSTDWETQLRNRAN
ncbi:MAG: hypothetical protein AAFP96_11130 [Bacteroidota bacterium]